MQENLIAILLANGKFSVDGGYDGTLIFKLVTRQG